MNRPEWTTGIALPHFLDARRPLFWLVVAYVILASTFVVSRVQNAQRINEDRRLNAKICEAERHADKIVIDIIRGLILNQQHLDPITVYTLGQQLADLRRASPTCIS